MNVERFHSLYEKRRRLIIDHLNDLKPRIKELWEKNQKDDAQELYLEFQDFKKLLQKLDAGVFAD